MNRLRDDSGEDPVAEKGIMLLRGTPPAPRMTDLKRRVWISLRQTERGRVRAASRLSKASLAPRMKAFAVVVAMVCVAGSAGAVIVGRWIAPHRNPAAQSSVQRVEPKTTTKRKVAGKVAGEIAEPKLTERAVAEPPVAESVMVEAPSPARTQAPTDRYAGTPAGRARRSAPPTPPTPESISPSGSLQAMPETVARASARASAREQTEVLDAMIALRRDHDPVRAGALLDRYLAAHPRGALHEEALVLAIEAAGKRGDHASARMLARIYQSDHPKGRFRQFALSHIESNAP